MSWMEDKVFARIALAMNGVRLGWLRMRENFVACDIDDSRTEGRRERLREMRARYLTKIEECEKFGELLRKQIKGEFKKPDIKLVA